MRVRAANANDLDELARLRAVWHGPEMPLRFDQDFRDWFHREESSRWWWMAVDDAGRGAGMVNVKIFERMPSSSRPMSRWGYLANLFVAPRARGAGVGTSLVQAAVDRAREEGLARLVLAPSELSKPLYVRLGFGPADGLLVHQLDA